MKVLLIDDHTLFRSGLRELLTRRGIEVLAAEGSGEEGILGARSLQPDVILLDLRMPELDGLTVLRRIVAMELGIPVVILTTSREETDLVESLRNGAQGYLLKDMEPDELVGALGDVIAGKTVVAPDMAGLLARMVKGDEAEEPGRSPFSILTHREMEILCHLAAGQSNKVIAKELEISDGTVKLHVKSILRKLEVHSRVEAAVLAVEHGLCHRIAGQ
ncbi:MAG: response regulator [Gammaproteobacteria bacterium]|nr:response regulator [Gammaproteobacteria bacterium]